MWVLTAFQAVNFLVLLLNAKYLFCESIYIVGPVVVFVGLMGGASYVNVLHGIRNLKTLSVTEIESAMSLCLIFNDLGIFCAAATSLILTNSLLYVTLDN